MPKVYGVRVGRQGPFVYTSWAECSMNVSGFPGSRYKGFSSLHEAEDWVFNAEHAQPIPEPSVGVAQLVDTPFQGQQSASPPMNREASTSHVGIGLLVLYIAGITLVDWGAHKYPPSVNRQQDSVLLTHQPPERNGMYCGSSVSNPPTPDVQPHTSATHAPVTLSDEQQRILNMVLQGRSLFFTGSAGTGKSVLLREIIRVLILRAQSRRLQLPPVSRSEHWRYNFAFLGSSGIGLGKESVETLVDKISGSKQARQRWCHTRTLIVDEISMVDGILLDKLDAIGRAIRHNYEAPFGGIQLVISGDFLQLPPVPDQLDGVSVPIKFAFEAAVWQQHSGPPEILTQVFRQHDQTFINILTNMRYGTLDALHARPLCHLSGRSATLMALMPLNFSPNVIRCYGPTKGRADSYGSPMMDQQVKKVLERLVAVSVLHLKVGAQVMLIKNMVQGHLVNGSVGKIVGFETAREAAQSRHEIGTVDRENDITSIVLSAERPENHSKTAPYAGVVEVMNVRGRVEAVRCQVPLILAWALSIHKSQGQTLERVRVSLSATFEKGQAYVALSRATSMEGLQVIGFNPSKVKAHPTVISWEKEVLGRQKLAN